MDIEQKLREKLPLENPGPRFTDGVMSRLGEAPVWQASDSVVRLSDARARWRSRGILLGTVVAIAAAASIPAFYLSKRADTPLVQNSGASSPRESAAADPAVLMPVETGSPGNGQVPPQCVDPDVLHGLLLGPTRTLHISDVSPPELAAFKAPRQLAWVGASEGSTGITINDASVSLSSVAAVYRTSLAPDAARIATVGGLAAGGWKLHSAGIQLRANVFTSQNSRPNGETHCREGKAVNVSASALDGVTYVVLSVSRRPDGAAGPVNACDQPPQPVARPPSILDKYMPRLELPRDPATGQPVSMRGGGVSNGEVKHRSDTSFTLKDSADDVARHFARQMAEQGWSGDTDWSGAGTAGSTWTMRPDPDSILLGTIAVSAFEDSRFTVVFSVVKTK